jgi:FMN phosphatase YigB (HAD superfamily)
LLTNLGDIFDEASEKIWHYDTLFDKDKIFVSCKMKMKKPDTKIYEEALKKLGRKPEETIFVDDRETNLVSPQKLGMNVILFKEQASFINEIFKMTGKKYA